MVIHPEMDPQSDVPLYRQLAQFIRELVENGQLARGERVPATRELAGLLGLNRTTVSAAYELLEAEGLIRGHVGRGSYVAAARPAPKSLDWETLLEPEPAPSQPLFTASAETISFATSRPSENLFPLDDFRATCEEVLRDPAIATVLQLGSPAGYAPLRRHLLNEAKRAGIARAGDDVMITSGCQQALDLVQRVLVRPGATVIVEEPVYPGLRALFAGAGAHLAGVEVGADGMNLEQLQRVLARGQVRLLVVTPNFQNPTGATLSEPSRLAIVRMAHEAGVVVVENDIYGGLRYAGADAPTLKQLDESGDTILLRSFSKISFPGLRVGWIIAPRPAINRLAEAKQRADLHSDQLSQAVLLRFAESGRLEAHSRRMIAEGARQLQAVLEACERYLPKGARFSRPQGGMNLWVQLPEPLDAGELLVEAQRENVIYLPGKYFAVSRHQPGNLRLSFAGLEPDKIRKGLAILGALFSRELDRARAARDIETAPAMV